MATSYLLILLISAGYCQATLWSIAGIEYIDGNGALVTYDTTTGKASTKTPTSPAFLTDPNLGCYDQVHNLYYNIYEIEAESYMRLYGFNLSNTSNQPFVTLLSQFDFVVNPVGSGNLCIGNPNTGDLYIMGYAANDSSSQLLYRAIYNPQLKSLNMNLIATYTNMNIDKYTQYSPYARIYDSKRDTIWFTVLRSQNGRDNTYFYYYINTKTGNIINNITSNNNLFWDTANYYNKVDQIVVLKLNTSIKAIQMMLVDPVNLTIITKYDAIPLINGYQVCQIEKMSTLDEENGIVWAMIYPFVKQYCGDGYLVGIYVNNGTLINNTPPLLCSTGIGVLCPESFQWTS